MYIELDIRQLPASSCTPMKSPAAGLQRRTSRALLPHFFFKQKKKHADWFT